MTKTIDYYQDLVDTDNFYDETIVIFMICKFEFPSLFYNEKDKCYYSLTPDREHDGNPYYIRLTLNPLEGGEEDDYEAIIDAGLYDSIYTKNNWEYKFTLGKVFYKNGLWTHK